MVTLADLLLLFIYLEVLALAILVLRYGHARFSYSKEDNNWQVAPAGRLHRLMGLSPGA